MDKKRKNIGNFAYYVAKLLISSLRLRVEKNKFYGDDRPYLFAFWHGKQFLPVQQLQQHSTPKAALVSPSKDGDILSQWLYRLNYDVIRGSARDKNVESTIAMVRKLKQDFSIGFGVDGPIGPIYKVKPGMIYLAQKTGIPIVPLGSAFSHKWVFEKAWDKYELPYPFARAAYYIGEPIIVDKSDDLAEMNIHVEMSLRKAELIAEEMLGD